MDCANHGTSFLDLPPEARNQIYELALIQERPIAVYLYTARGDAVKNLSPREPGLLAVNRQIREEAIEIFWNGNAFEATTMGGAAKLLEDLDDWKVASMSTLKIWNPRSEGLSCLCEGVDLLGRRFSKKGLRKEAVLIQIGHRGPTRWARLPEVAEFEIAEWDGRWCVGLNEGEAAKRKRPV